MKKPMLHILSTVTLAMAIATASPEIGDLAPVFNLPSSVGKNVSLSEFEGKIVVLNG